MVFLISVVNIIILMRCIYFEIHWIPWIIVPKYLTEFSSIQKKELIGVAAVKVRI